MPLTKENLDLTIASLNALPDQIIDILSYGDKLDLPEDYKNIDKVVVSGMGGSNLGARILNSVMSADLTCPIIINSDYTVPGFVNEKTLFVLSSYSGSTEETLISYQAAKAKNAKCLVITADSENNKLIALAQENNLPVLAFKVTYNPSNQPRLAVGYSAFALATVLDKLGVIKINQADLKAACDKLRLWGGKLAQADAFDNEAKNIARGLMGKQIVLVGGEFLAGNIHALRNQINENAKQFASYLVLPDLNHYAMEGLVKPDNNKENIIFFFFDSALYSDRVQLRSKLTKQVVAQNNISFVDISLTGVNKLEQSLEVLQLGAWMTFYLALLNEVNPLEIPFVDWFKNELK